MNLILWFLPVLYGFRYYLEFSDEWLAAQLLFVGVQLFFTIYLLLRFSSKHTLSVIKINKKIFVFFIIFIVTGWIATIRGAINGHTSLIRAIFQISASCLVFINLFLYITNRIAERKEYHIWKDLVVGLLLFSLLNLIGLFIFGIRFPIEDQFLKNIESNLKFINYRIYFPFVYSNRTFTIEMGVLFTTGMCLLFLLSNKRLFLKIFAALGCFCALFAMLLSDGRIPFFFSFLSVFYLFFKKDTQRYAPIIVLILILYPFIFAAYVATHIELIYLNSDLYTLNGRFQIWSYLFGKITQNFDLNYFFGFGAFGQQTSRYVYEYSQGFKEAFANIDLITAHNSLLQLFMDEGIVGLLIFVLFLFALSMEVMKSHENRLVGSFVILSYIISSSGTEISISIYYESILSLFIFCVINIMIKYKSNILHKNIELSGID